MDRQQLIDRLQPFLELSEREGKPMEIVRLDDALPGLPGNGYILRIVAPWSAGLSFGETMDAVLDLLWRSTDVTMREGISSLHVRPRREDLATSFAGWA